MAESTQEKTEEATSRKLEEARDQGQVPLSKELLSAILLTAMAGLSSLFGRDLVVRIAQIIRGKLTFTDLSSLTPSAAPGMLASLFTSELSFLAPLLLAIPAVILLFGQLQTGFHFSGKTLRFDLERIDPVAGAKRLFSLRSVVAVAFGLAKAVLVGLVSWLTIRDFVPRMLNAGFRAIQPTLLDLAEVMVSLLLRVGITLVSLALIDVLWQRFRHGQDLRMTKEEVTEDRRMSEGDPKIKARIRQVQRQIARARMLQDVKKATVVIRNPTHYAVALRYDKKKDPAPRVVAKGKDLMALRIIEMATKAAVPVRSDPPLARELHRTVALGATVPEALFRAVAKILAWVYRQRPRSSAGGAQG